MIVLSNKDDLNKKLNESFVKCICSNLFSHHTEDTAPILIFHPEENIKNVEFNHIHSISGGVFNYYPNTEEPCWEFVDKFVNDGNECNPDTEIWYGVAVINGDDAAYCLIPRSYKLDDTVVEKLEAMASNAA